MVIKKGGLGRGLDALFNENSTDNNIAIEVKLVDVEPNKDQPRKKFDSQAISELAASIKEHGLIQPIVVKPLTNGTYRIIAGERRWRACREAGLEKVPVIVKDLAEQQVMEVALIENLQRQDLNPVEEALGYKALIDAYDMTQEQVAGRVGKSRVAVTNALRLLNLSEIELEMLQRGTITAGQARTFLSTDDKLLRERLQQMALSGASVRELEQTVKAAKRSKESGNHDIHNSFYTEVELALKETLHRKVKVVKLGENHGMISLEFYGDEELRDIAAKLGRMH